MILAWMVYASLLALAAGIAARILESAARALQRSTRFVWLAALGFSVLWPLVRLTGELLAIDHRSAAPDAILAPMIVAAERGVGAGLMARVVALGTNLSTALLVLWGITSLMLLMRLVRGSRELATRRRGWAPQTVDGVPLLVAADAGPAVVGVGRPEIVIPEWVLALDPTLRALVLRHEVEHVHARDTAPRLFGAVVTALLPWNPALWWQVNRLTLAIEVDCDARVLRADARRKRYGQLLLAIAQRQSLPRLSPALSEPSSHLERRITVMHRTQPRRPMLVALVLAAGAAAALALACSAPTPDAPTAKAVPVEARSAGAAAPVRAAEPYREFQVENQATLIQGSGMPRYPDALRKQHVEGTVLAQFIVDATGRPEASTLKVLKSDNEQFTRAVKSALAGMRFTPAKVGGRAVKQLVQMPFQFSLAR